MARYDREDARYDIDLLQMMVTEGLGTYFPAADTYVIKVDGRSLAVRSHQVITRAEKAVTMPVIVIAEEKVASPMDGYYGQERYDGEDTGPGGVVYDSMLELAQSWIATEGIPGMDPLYLVRQMLDDPQYEADIRAQAENGRRVTRTCRRAAEAKELLKHFGG